MKSVCVKSVGQILQKETNITEDTLVLSFCNKDSLDIIEVQKRAFISNPSLIKFQKNVLIIEKDDVQKLSSIKYFIHNIRPYSNIFSIDDLKEVIYFLKKNNYEEKDIIIQCEYGKSRSLTLAMCLIETILNNSHELKHDENKKRNKVIEQIFNDNIDKLT